MSEGADLTASQAFWATPTPTTMIIPQGEWNVFVNGVQLAKYTGPESLVFSVTFIPPLTEAEKAENAK